MALQFSKKHLYNQLFALTTHYTIYQYSHFYCVHVLNEMQWYMKCTTLD